MEYLKVSNLSKSYTDKPLVDQVSFSVDKGQKIAIVAKNGAGKSTLLKLLTHQLDVTDGSFSFHKDCKVGFLTQGLILDSESTVLDTLFDNELPAAQVIKRYEHLLSDSTSDPDDMAKILGEIEELDAREYETKVKTIISKLELAEYLNKTISKLSGGEIKRVALAKVLVDEPDFLLLDEPTNHLDLDMIEWLENYLGQYSITLLMVTHDRYFLERVCSDIWELDRGKIYQYPGNYSYFLEKKAEREKNEAIEMKNLRKLLKQELAWIRKSPRARESKSSFREKRFYDIESRYDSRKAVIGQENIGLEIGMEERRLGAKIIKIHNLVKSFGDKKIVEDFSYDFRHKERIGIVGNNGVGKSTFVRMLTGEESFDSGSIKVGDTVVFGHYLQKEVIFPANKRIIDVVTDVAEFMYIGKNEKLSASHLLERFLFPPQQQYQFAHTLSGGEKRRLHLLTVLIKNPNFLILDEPTNDLDLLTINVLEKFLLQYQGCLLIISHDRFFMDRIVDHLFVFEGDGAVEDFWGTYAQYKEKLRIKSLEGKNKNEKQRNKDEKYRDRGSKEIATSAVADSQGQKKKLSYMEKREFEQLEKDLEKLEKRKDEINLLFHKDDIPYDDIQKLSEELGEIMRQIETKEMRWLDLSERV